MTPIYKLLQKKSYQCILENYNFELISNKYINLLLQFSSM